MLQFAIMINFFSSRKKNTFLYCYIWFMKEIRVVELFAGVGGFRLGLEGYDKDGKGKKSASSHYTMPFESPYKVIWSNQWEPSSKKSGAAQEANLVYHKNWPNTATSVHYPNDLNTVASPDFTDKKLILLFQITICSLVDSHVKIIRLQV